MEHPHHRRRIVGPLAAKLRRAGEILRQKDEQALEEYAFLQQAGEDVSSELDRLQKRLGRLLLLCAAACLLLFLLAALIGRQDAGLEMLLQRPSITEDDAYADVRVTLQWQEASWKQDVRLDVPRQEISAKDARALFERCRQWLETEVFGSRQDLGRVTGDLKLPLQDETGLIAIGWSSSDPSRIAEDGRVNLTGVRDGESVELAASLQAGDHGDTLRFTAVFAPSEAKDLTPSLQYEAEEMLQQLPELLTEVHQVLPEKTPGGADADWALKREGLPWEIAGVFFLAAVFLVFSRTDSLKKHLKERKAAFEQEIPNMSLQMILLLNAGLTVEGSFQRLVQENRDRDHPLYQALCSLDAESRATNLPFVNALYVYARQSGIRDLIRFSSLALDCSGRGAELSEKLDRERQQLWNVRLNQAKARAKEAETKLCLPLMILLLVLVVIAIAPALMEM